MCIIYVSMLPVECIPVILTTGNTGLHASLVALTVEFLSEGVGVKCQRWLVMSVNGLKCCAVG